LVVRLQKSYPCIRAIQGYRHRPYDQTKKRSPYIRRVDMVKNFDIEKQRNRYNCAVFDSFFNFEASFF
jgi:hypothetical protein